MRTDIYGQIILTEHDLCDLYLTDPEKAFSTVLTETDIPVNEVLNIVQYPTINKYIDPSVSVTEFDLKNQMNWYMPAQYKEMDIAKYILDQCSSEAELQRAGKELLLFQQREMFDLLRYLKYLVDTMRQNNIVWGVGRGSSVASYILYLLGVHKINSLYWDLPIEEFLK